MAGVWAILTAAGESTRMGRPKPLLPWCGATLVECQVSALADAGAAHVVVVVGHEADAVIPYVVHPRASYVVNPDFLSGKATSVKAGLRAVGEGADAVLLLAVDQPRPATVISRVIEAHLDAGALITSPRFEGGGGHPLIFAASLRAELEVISEETEGVREVFQAHRREVNKVPIDDPVIRLDLNTPEDYERAKRLYGSSRPPAGGAREGA